MTPDDCSRDAAEEPNLSSLIYDNSFLQSWRCSDEETIKKKKEGGGETREK